MYTCFDQTHEKLVPDTYHGDSLVTEIYILEVVSEDFPVRHVVGLNVFEVHLLSDLFKFHLQSFVL